MNTKLIEAVCNLLHISLPKITQTNELPRNCLGQYDYLTDTITVRNLDDTQTIIHELRHKWQYIHGSYPPGLKGSGHIHLYGISYNTQPQEIDANAFAIYITKAHLLSRLSYEDVVKRCRFISAEEVSPIAERLKYIAEEEFPTHTEAVLAHYHS